MTITLPLSCGSIVPPQIVTDRSAMIRLCNILLLVKSLLSALPKTQESGRFAVSFRRLRTEKLSASGWLRPPDPPPGALPLDPAGAPTPDPCYRQAQALAMDSALPLIDALDPPLALHDQKWHFEAKKLQQLWNEFLYLLCRSQFSQKLLCLHPVVKQLFN